MKPSKLILTCVSLAVVMNHFRTAQADTLRVELNKSEGTISVFRENGEAALLTQNARPDFRPYIHPIIAPGGHGVLTEYSPGHHKHQTGLYWGFTRLNGRDFFHHPEGDYWKRVSSSVLEAAGQTVRWQTVYDLLGEEGDTLLTETQTWSMREQEGHYVLDLLWQGHAKVDVTIGKYDYGGLFLRMPWRPGIQADVVNGARQRNQRAEGQRSLWVDVGMQIDGRTDMAHIAIFDHPENSGYPQPWRVDGQMGVGPVRARIGDWQIEKGETATIRHQLIVYSGELNDVELTKQWSAFSGQGGTYAQWQLAQREGRTAEFLTPEKAIDAMTLQDGFTANVYASEPMITQPMAFCWDDRGRMWIAENRDYETRGRGFSNSGDSRILILEDQDRDGVADSKKVFLEGIPFPAAIAVGFDGLWLGAPPNLLFVPDRDRDDRGDMDNVEVRLTGWGIRDRHETLNSLHWGPDGWLYGCQGYATPSRVGKPAGQGRLYKHREPFPKDIALAGEAIDINGGVWRYHPTKDRFEVVAHGFSNPWGIDYDARGQLFITACVIPHLWHVIPGGIYHRQGGKHFNPYVYGDIRTITDHRHRSAHGGARIYLSDAFPKKYHQRIFMANIHEHAVLTDILEPRGSGFVGHHGDDFLLANNAQWIGFSVEIGPEGAVYVLDWHDADICGKDVLNKGTGRVFRVAPDKSNAQNWEGRYSDLNLRNNKELVELQTNASAWHARRARVILQYRASQGNVDEAARTLLRDMFLHDSNTSIRLRAMWSLHVTGGMAQSDLLTSLSDKDAPIRAWAIQLLCEDHSPPPEALDSFEAMASDDRSPMVRLYLAAALQRMTHEDRWPIARELVTHGEDANDHNIPKMIWFGIEPLIPTYPDRGLELTTRSNIPLVTRFIARRLTDADKLESLITAIGQHEEARHDLLDGLYDGLEGRRDVITPRNWPSVYAKLDAAGGDVARIATEISQRLGDTAAAERMLSVLTDEQAELERRRQALRGLASQGFTELEPHLESLLDTPTLRREAIRAIAAFENDHLANVLVDRYHEFDADTKLDAVQTLASRSRSGWALTKAIESGHVPRRDIPAYVARQLRRVVGNGFLEIWGPIDALSTDKEAAFTKYRGLLTDEVLNAADRQQGRVVFQRTCMTCHKLYGEGGNIGPDITGANRTNLEYILGNVLTPSAEIQDAYKMLLVVTDEGRLFSGILAGENERQLRLRVAGEDEPVIIPKSSIESREVAPVSMMPDGLLANLKDKEVVDLVAYLRSLQQVELPPVVDEAP